MTGHTNEPASCDWTAPFVVSGLLASPFNDVGQNDSFWLSADGLNAYLTRDEDYFGPEAFQTYVASRPSVAEKFPLPQRLQPAPIGEQRQVALSGDRLLLAYQDEHHVFLSRRSSLDEDFPAAKRLEIPVGNQADDFDPNFTADGSALFFSSTRAGSLDLYWTQLRAEGPTGDVHALMELNTDAAEGAPALSADGLTLYFARGKPSQIFVAHRPDTQSAFADARAIAELGSESIRWPESVSPDGCTLYFAELRGGLIYELFQADRAR